MSEAEAKTKKAATVKQERDAGRAIVQNGTPKDPAQQAEEQFKRIKQALRGPDPNWAIPPKNTKINS